MDRFEWDLKERLIEHVFEAEGFVDLKRELHTTV